MPGQTGVQRDFIDRLVHLEDKVRSLRIASKAKTETKTFIVPGSINASLYIPPVGIAVNLDGDSIEWKEIIGFGGQLRSGSINVNWVLDGVTIKTDHLITSSGWSGNTLVVPAKLPKGWHVLECVVTGGSGSDLSAAYAAATGR